MFCRKNSLQKTKERRQLTIDQKDINEKNLLTNDELIELLTSSYVLGYMNTWEKFRPESKIYTEGVVNNGN